MKIHHKKVKITNHSFIRKQDYNLPNFFNSLNIILIPIKINIH